MFIQHSLPFFQRQAFFCSNWDILKMKNQKEGDFMSPKELLYVEDALSHEQFMQTQCQQALQALTDPELKNCVQQLQTRHQQLFAKMYQLV